MRSVKNGTLLLATLGLAFTACGTAEEEGGSCELAADTTATNQVSSLGCALLTRDTSSCQSERESQGLSGFWLKFSCRVSLTKSGDTVVISTDGQPDYASKYFEETNSCYEEQDLTGRRDNPNLISAQNIRMTVDYTPAQAGSATTTSEGTVGVALNGVSIFDNTAAGTDDIYEEALTFDACDGHSEPVKGAYHYHTEPVSITQDDDAFVGVLKDGFPVYGKFCNGGTSAPTGLDAQSGHTSATIDSTTPVYHYHVNKQTSTSSATLGQEAWFITDGAFTGTAGSCSGC